MIIDIYFYTATPTQDDVLLEGITDDMEEVGTILPLTCTINRIRPKAVDFYYSIDGHRENGTLETEVRNAGFVQTITLKYK